MNHRPPRYKTLTATLEEVRALRASALVKATETLIALLDNPSGAIRLAAAEALANRLEGKPGQTVTIAGPDMDELQERAAIRALFGHWVATCPAAFAAGLEWAKRIHAGTPAPVPDGLVPPTTEPALSLWNRLLGASSSVQARAEGMR